LESNFVVIQNIKKFKNNFIYKSFSESENTEFILSNFKNIQNIQSFQFNAYPIYHILKNDNLFHDFILFDNIYYINAMESIIRFFFFFYIKYHGN
jgi:hypothetical protein